MQDSHSIFFNFKNTDARLDDMLGNGRNKLNNYLCPIKQK